MWRQKSSKLKGLRSRHRSWSSKARTLTTLTLWTLSELRKQISWLSWWPTRNQSKSHLRNKLNKNQSRRSKRSNSLNSNPPVRSKRVEQDWQQVSSMRLLWKGLLPWVLKDKLQFLLWKLPLTTQTGLWNIASMGFQKRLHLKVRLQDHLPPLQLDKLEDWILRFLWVWLTPLSLHRLDRWSEAIQMPYPNC